MGFDCKRIKYVLGAKSYSGNCLAIWDDITLISCVYSTAQISASDSSSNSLLPKYSTLIIFTALNLYSIRYMEIIMSNISRLLISDTGRRCHNIL